MSVTQVVLSEYSRVRDAEASASARLLYEQFFTETDPLVQLELTTKVQVALGRASPTFSDAWFDWAGAGFPEDATALGNEDYLAYRDSLWQSYSYTASVAGALGDAYQERAQVLAQASLVNALALFLVGVSAVNRSPRIRLAVLAIGTAVVLAGLVFASTAY